MFHHKRPSLFELARHGLASTEHGYDLLAPKFDYTPFLTPDSVLAVVSVQLQEFAPFNSILDICCGTGAAIQKLDTLCSHRMVGIDMSAGMLEVARANTQSATGNPYIQFVRGNALQMPFNSSFDLAVCFGAFGHILPQDSPRLIRQITGALKPGGKFVFVTSKMPPRWSRAYWFARVFNATMHLRNWIIKPPFIMYYLTFLLPAVRTLLEEQGLDVEVRHVFDTSLEQLRLVIATRKSQQ